ncbi:ABC transporter ATP-binding protein [Chelatococcus reniformis]|uniref:ABC transporter ATP-binding protein n=1 Tax=Chelatococcus reniformis TaxID=1494448 RepID=A0A916UCI1_9HYPH|nr:ABC transporter ATP-binding protein [Chelatococcus reniformis]GGC66002.1 ABC transporter ATP-binding protein [Chelatococcus reniformis]
MIVAALLPAEARARLVPFALLAVVAAALRAASALLLVPLLGGLFSQSPRAALPWLGALAVSVAAGWILERHLVIRSFDLGFAMMGSMNQRLVDHLMAVQIGWFGAERQAQAKRALAGAVPELFASTVNLATQASICVALPPAIAIGLLFVAWPLGLVALAAVPLLFGALLLGGRLMRRAEADFAAASGEVAARTEEFARSQLMLRAAGRTGTSGTPLGDAIATQRRSGLRILWFALPGTLAFSLAMQATLLAMVAVLALMFTQGTDDAVRTVALIVVALRFLEPLNTLSELFPALESTRAAAGRVLSVLDVPTQTKPERDARPGPAAVAFRNVCFAADGKRVLENVSFVVPAGTMTAIVGPSGSGKSTILSLVARLLDADAGEVEVCRHDVRGYRPDTLMEQLAVVFQNVQLFEGGIAENIRIARPQASDADLQAAASAAGVDEIVARLGSWDAPVGEGGGALSGGERQRVSIARALLKQAPILLLDEATSGLDTLNEAAVATALSRFSHCTVLVVAHRLETIAHADQIVFVEAGRVVESGFRESLVAAGGRFAAYWHHRRDAQRWQMQHSHAGALRDRMASPAGGRTSVT